MKVFADRPKFPLKLAASVLPLYLVSLFLPFLSIRENRISAEISRSVFSFGLLPTLLLILPAVMVALHAVRKDKSATDWMLTIASSLGIFVPFLLLAFFGTESIDGMGPFSRFSPASGLYVYILATLVIYLMQPSLRRRDLIGALIGVAIVVAVGAGGSFERLGMLLEAQNLGRRLYGEILAHMRITGISIGISVVLGIPIALGSYQNTRLRKLVFPLLNVLQTIPGIALFGLLIAPLAALSQAFPMLRAWGIKGIGNTPAIIALSIYAIYPIIRYSFTAFSSIDEQVISAAKGMGMNAGQVWTMVRFPLATAGVLHGIRVALVQTIGNATLAKLIGGDGLGVLVFEGLGQASVDMVLLGMLLIIALTIIADRIFQIIIVLFTPKALRERGR